MPTVVFEDLFTDTDGTLLSAHTPTTGGAWTGTPTAFSIQTNRCYSNAAGGVRVRGGTDVSTDDIDVEAPVKLITLTGNGMMLIGRYASGATFNGFGARLDGVGTTIQLYKITNNAFTLLASAAVSYIAGDEPVMKLECRTAAKKVFLDGVEKLSNTDDTHTGSGHRGSGLRAGDAYTTTTGQHYASIKTTDPAAGVLTAASDVALAYDILNQTSKDTALAYDILNQVSKDTQLVYDLLNQIARDTAVTYDILNQASKDTQLAYDVSALAASDVALVYDVLNQTSMDWILVYDLGLVIGGGNRLLLLRVA